MGMKTVNDIYAVAVENSTPLLSNYNSSFWTNYLTNYTYYDRLFRRSYLSFKYFLQQPDATAEEVLSEFTNEVYAHLLINDKKYSELYRLNNLSDSNYDFTKPYDITETYDGQYEDDGTDSFGSSTNTNTNVFGSRQDTDSMVTGAQTTTNTNTVSPYDTDEFYNETKNTDAVGGRTDSSTTNVGEQTNTETQAIGAKENSNHKAGTASHTLNRSGYDSKHLPTESLEAHEKFWSMYEFYAYIFSEICAELLIV